LRGRSKSLRTRNRLFAQPTTPANPSNPGTAGADRIALNLGTGAVPSALRHSVTLAGTTRRTGGNIEQSRLPPERRGELPWCRLAAWPRRRAPRRREWPRRYCHAMAIVVGVIDSTAFGRQRNAPNCRAWPQTRFANNRRRRCRRARRIRAVEGVDALPRASRRRIYADLHRSFHRGAVQGHSWWRIGAAQMLRLGSRTFLPLSRNDRILCRFRYSEPHDFLCGDFN
jgi:hypothetical protein